MTGEKSAGHTLDGDPLAALRRRIDELEGYLAEADGDALRAILHELTGIVDALRAGTALQTSEERFRALIENALDVVSLLDADGRLLYNTPNVSRVFGYDPHNAVGRVAMLDGVHPDDVERAAALFLEARRSPGRPVTTEIRVRRADGAWLWVEGTACNMLDNPHVRAIVVNSRNVTDRKRAEGAARQRQVELAHVLRVHSMGEVASGLAHEINQPLAAIVNYARGCVRRLQGWRAPDGVVDALERITEEALRAGGVVRGLRQFLRKEPPRRAPEDLNALALEAVRLSEADGREHAATIRCDLGPGMPLVEVDRVQIEQVIVNLIRNGLEAMAPGEEARREIVVRTAVADAVSLTVSVCDRGSGLTADVAERMFDPFFTTKPNGLGMGLSISRSIVDDHGGRIWAAPNADGGITVSFTIPLRASPAEQPEGHADGNGAVDAGRHAQAHPQRR